MAKHNFFGLGETTLLQNGYSAADQINVMKLRLPRCNLIAVNHNVIEESNRVVSPRPKNYVLP
jgi:hypothetical protein